MGTPAASSRNLFFIVGFGLLPIWIIGALFLLTTLGFEWAFIGAFLVMLAIPACACTLFIVAMTYSGRALAGNDDAKKKKYGRIAFAATTLLVVVAVGGGALWKLSSAAWKKERETAAADFARGNPRVKEMVPGADRIYAREIVPPKGPRFFLVTIGFEAETYGRYLGVLSETPDGAEPFRLECLVTYEHSRFASLPNDWCPALR